MSLASETCKEVQKKQSSSPKSFSLHHVGSFVCRVIFSDVMNKNVEVVFFKFDSQPAPDLDKRNEGLFLAYTCHRIDERQKHSALSCFVS